MSTTTIEQDLTEPTTVPKPNVLVDLVSGSVGGAAQVLVGQPLDTLKTRAQTAPPGMFKNTWDIFRQTVAKEGVLALYKGMASPLLGIAAVNSLLFSANGFCRRLVSPFSDLSIGQIAIAGGGAGAINAVLASPVELFKIKMQGQYGGVGDKKLAATIKDQYQKYGFRHGIMRGYWVTVAREIPAYAAFYAAYESTKRQLLTSFPPSSTSSSSTQMGIYMFSGATGGVAYWLACYPLDVVKSKVQLAGTPPVGVGYVWREMKGIAEQGGVRALFRGISPTLLRSIPAAASTFLAFEVTKTYIEDHRLL